MLTFDPVLSNFPALKASDLIKHTFIADGVIQSEHTLSAARLAPILALYARKPHPIFALQLQRIFRLSPDPLQSAKNAYEYLTDAAQAVQDARWSGEPWRWNQDEAVQFFGHLHDALGNLTGSTRDDTAELLDQCADSVARAFMVPPAEESMLISLGASAHEQCLIAAMHCASVLAGRVAASTTRVHHHLLSWPDFVETTTAAMQLVKRATSPHIPTPTPSP